MAQHTIPGSPDDVTAEWLSAVLSTPGTPVDVAAAAVGPIGTGQTGATYRVTATYRSGGDGLPATFVVKLPSQEPEVRARAAFGYKAEHAFILYQNIPGCWLWIRPDTEGGLLRNAKADVYELIRKRTATASAETAKA